MPRTHQICRVWLTCTHCSKVYIRKREKAQASKYCSRPCLYAHRKQLSEADAPRQCKKCGEIKALDRFPIKNGRGYDRGLKYRSWICQECSYVQRRPYQAKWQRDYNRKLRRDVIENL